MFDIITANTCPASNVHPGTPVPYNNTISIQCGTTTKQQQCRFNPYSKQYELAGDSECGSMKIRVWFSEQYMIYSQIVLFILYMHTVKFKKIIIIASILWIMFK